MNHGLQRWRGRVALVTGASGGIGAAVARQLSAAGMKLGLCARRTDRLEALRVELERAGGEVEALTTDLRDAGAITAAFARLRQKWGGVDVLVNNAGLGRAASLLDGDVDAWREMLEVNVLAVCMCTQEAVADMRRRHDDGHVVNVASMSAHRVAPGSGVYSATKFAVRSLTESLRQELRAQGSGIRVSAISPGLCDTEFHQAFHGGDSSARALGPGEMLTADDVAASVSYVLSQPPGVQVHDVLLRPTSQLT